MLEGGKISYKQMILLVFISRVITWIALLPVILAPPANQDVWLDCLMEVPIFWIAALPFYLLFKKFPNQTFYEYIQNIIGKSGRGIGILYIWFFFHLAAIAQNQISEFLTTIIMPETPSLFFVITLTLAAAYAVHYGIEILGRLSEFFAPLMIIAIISVIVLLIKDMDFKALTPILEKGLYPSIFTGLSPVSETVEIIGIAIISPFLSNLQDAKKVYLFTPLLLGLFLFILTASVLTLLGADLAKTFTYPFYSAVRLVHVGDFLERIEAIHVAIWILGMFIKTAFYYYLVVLGISQLFHLKSYKPLILPVGAIIVSLSNVLGQNVVETREFYSFKIYTWYSLFFIVLTPALLLVTATLRKKGERSK